MKAVELRDMMDEDLLVRLEALKEELFNLRFQVATGQLDNPMRMKQVRHDVARVLTVLRERHVEGEIEADVAAAERRSLEERRAAIASGELKGSSLTELAEDKASPTDEAIFAHEQHMLEDDSDDEEKQ
jgi:large subunit ribosomal protein L29